MRSAIDQIFQLPLVTKIAGVFDRILPGVDWKDLRIWAVFLIVFSIAGLAGSIFAGQLLLVYGFLFALARSYRRNDRDPIRQRSMLFYLGFAAAIYYVVDQFLINFVLAPAELRANQRIPSIVFSRFPMDSFFELLIPFLAPLMAWGLAFRLSHIRLAIVSLVLLMLGGAVWGLPKLLSLNLDFATRQTFFSANYIHESLLFGMALLAAFFFVCHCVTRWLCEVLRGNAPPRLWETSGWLLLSLAGLTLLTVALWQLGSRAVWLAVALSLSGAAVFLLVVSKNTRVRQLILIGVAVAVLGLVLLSQQPWVKRQMNDLSLQISSAGEVFTSSATWVPQDGRIDSAREIRLAKLHLAIALVRQRPWFGWGLSQQPLFANNPLYPSLRGHFSFDNSYLELLVRVGFVGAFFHLLLYLRLLFGVFRLAYLSRGSERISLAFPALFLAWLILLWSGDLFSSTLFNVSGRTQYFLLGGMILAAEGFALRLKSGVSESL